MLLWLLSVTELLAEYYKKISSSVGVRLLSYILMLLRSPSRHEFLITLFKRLHGLYTFGGQAKRKVE